MRFIRWLRCVLWHLPGEVVYEIQFVYPGRPMIVGWTCSRCGRRLHP